MRSLNKQHCKIASIFPFILSIQLPHIFLFTCERCTNFTVAIICLLLILNSFLPTPKFCKNKQPKITRPLFLPSPLNLNIYRLLSSFSQSLARNQQSIGQTTFYFNKIFPCQHIEIWIHKIQNKLFTFHHHLWILCWFWFFVTIFFWFLIFFFNCYLFSLYLSLSFSITFTSTKTKKQNNYNKISHSDK